MGEKVRAALLEATACFKSKEMPNPRRQAEDLLCDLLDCPRSQLYQHFLQELSIEKMEKLRIWIERRIGGEPLAYLSGKVQFYDCSIEVNSTVLIPRPETEILVDRVVNYLKKSDMQGKVLWDLCCGSGCIGIAIKKALPYLTVFLSDISEQALALASQNARSNQVDVVCLYGDLLAPFQGKKAHYIVANPPYISEKEYGTLDREVKEFEPRMALMGGVDGLEIYARLAQELPAYLYPHAKVWLEIGYQQGEAVKNLFHFTPWKNQRVEKDWSGHSRFFSLEME